VVPACATYQPVVAQIAEDHIVTIGVNSINCGAFWAFCVVEVEKELHSPTGHELAGRRIPIDLRQRIILIIGAEFSRPVDPVLEDVALIYRIVVVFSQRLSAGNRIVTIAAVQEVITPASEDDVIGLIEFIQVLGHLGIAQLKGR